MTRTITNGVDEWPALLNELGPEKPPEKLYVAGRLLPDPERSIAIVGTRRPTIAGLEIAHEMARAFGEAGYAIVSGLALGIDAAAHRGALEAAAHTVAVLGCGLDVIYPQRNHRLKEQIAARGTIVTEQPPGVPPLSHHFPARNRIIVGLSKAVVVVEGGFRSGALITARLALDANRDVFAVPGSPRNAVAHGSNYLIRTGQAALVNSPQDVFDQIAPGVTWTRAYDPEAPCPLGREEAFVLHSLDAVPVSVDQIARATRLPTGDVAMRLAKLEVRGLARRTRTGRYEITDAGLRVSLASA